MKGFWREESDLGLFDLFLATSSVQIVVQIEVGHIMSISTFKNIKLFQNFKLNLYFCYIKTRITLQW
ncbi:hypothetical protein KFK09_022799 [Dendrobium nobile]|uniref:Uncharacterized protein n=1 Tax=Dendrobium nobile TaxID=94219 RepID=A0A8T3AKY1_DENNO|nr:hypothetical protein KFK09_022799 [Dendrobium nobile]